MEILSDAENKLLERREIKTLFKGLSGKLTRSNAVETVSSTLKVNTKQVHVVNLMPSAGSRNIKGFFYVYRDEAAARKHLPNYLFLRVLPKEERQKAAAAKKAKAEAKPAEKPAKPAEKAGEKPVEKPPPKIERKSEGKSAGKSEGKTDATPAAKTEEKSEAKPEAKAAAKPATKPGAKESK